MPKKLYKDIPQNYPVCQQQQCPLAKHCLHQIAYAPLLLRDTYLKLINPTQCSCNETCPHFRDAQPIVYARGFLSMQKKMFPEQYQTFMSRLIAHFGRNPYFERRRGETALSPKEQEIVCEALKHAGVTEHLDFDHYEENLCWYD